MNYFYYLCTENSTEINNVVMKKYLSTALVIMMLVHVASASAQDCKAIVLPRLHYDLALYDEMMEYSSEKLDDLCTFSKNTFFEADKVPSDAVVYEITDVTFYKDMTRLPKDFVVDLNTLSYYAYDFMAFQMSNYGKTLYFRTPGSVHKYLGVRSIEEVNSITK